MKKKICGIYAIINKTTKKTYVGQSVNIEERWRQHQAFYGIDHHSAIDLALQKYGNDAFDFVILEECAQEELNQKEKYYVELLDTYYPNGYNINIAGESFHNPMFDVEVSCYTENGDLICTYSSLRAADRAGFCRQNISAIINNRGAKTAYGFYWAIGHEAKIIINKPKAGKMGGKTVYQYDIKTGQQIGSFKSVADAERFLNKPGGNKNISAACNGKRKSAYGYKWSYENKHILE